MSSESDFRGYQVHYKGACELCGGFGYANTTFSQCNTCNGKGGSGTPSESFVTSPVSLTHAARDAGTFGPCSKGEVHYKGPCDKCAGKGYFATYSGGEPIYNFCCR